MPRPDVLRVLGFSIQTCETISQDEDYAGYPQAHRASLRTVALTEYASRDMFLKIFEFFKGLF